MIDPSQPTPGGQTSSTEGPILSRPRLLGPRAALVVYERGGARVVDIPVGTSLVLGRQQPVDVVLTDMAMPIMDGPSTIIALRRINPSVRIVGASGLGSNSKFAHALGAGLAHFLHKPYTAESLLLVLRRALEDTAPVEEKT